MTSPSQEYVDNATLTHDPSLMPQSKRVQDPSHIHNVPLENQPIKKETQNCQFEETPLEVEENEARLENETVQIVRQKREENVSVVVQKEQTSKSKQVKFIEEIPEKSQHSIELNFECQTDPNQTTEQFQVHIHQVESKQSLSQNGEQRYQIIFTKSEINIPIQYQGGEDQDQNAKKLKLNELQSANCSIRPSEDDDFYVQRLQQKWAKRQQEQNQMNQLISNLEKNYQQSQTLPNSVTRNKQSNQCQLTESHHQLAGSHHQLTGSHHQKSTLIPNPKKNQFKVKKVHDQKTASTSNVKSLLNTTNHLKSFKAPQNKGQFLNTKTNELKPYNYSRMGKKHMSNFEVSCNKTPSKQSIYKNQINLNVHYEISIGNAVQMMSQILQDRCYNTENHKKVCSDLSQNTEAKPQVAKKVRKIIKRSPYGILEIQVKDNSKNSAKITNLRILKPKEMIRLKKIPNLVKGNKENVVQKSIGRFEEKSIGRFEEKSIGRFEEKSIGRFEEKISQKQGSLGQGGLPLLNCNRK